MNLLLCCEWCDTNAHDHAEKNLHPCKPAAVLLLILCTVTPWQTLLLLDDDVMVTEDLICA